MAEANNTEIPSQNEDAPIRADAMATPAPAAKADVQGRNEVYFFIADPAILPKFLIPGSKRDENFDPLSRKILVIQNS